MDYENFKEQFIEQLQEKFYERGVEDVNLIARPVEKLNGGYDAVTITPVDSKIGVTLNIGSFFEAYENGTDMSTVVGRAADVAIRGFENVPTVDISSLTDYEQMKDKLAIEVVSTEANKEMLATVPHKEIEDMSVVYRFVLDENVDGRASILATNNMIGTMGITADQLHADALENAPKIRPAEITGMSEMMAQMVGREQAEQMGIFPMDPADEQMYVATVSDKIHGAGILAYQDFMDQAAERLGGQSFFILPSSLHEILLVPDNGQMNLHDLEAMVKEVNATQVEPEDKLTDSVYHYDAKDKIFELGEKFEARQAEKEAGIDKAAEKESVLGDLKAKKEEVAKQPKKETVDKTKGRNGQAL